VMGVPEAVVDGETGLLVSPGRPDLLAEALRRLAGAPELRERMGRAGRRAVLQAFDIEGSAGAIADLLVGGRDTAAAERTETREHAAAA
jgi:glycosyltransferase involved in cell wall biosynthesis